MSQPGGLPTVAEVRERLARLRARIVAAGGDANAVAVLAVTKGHPPEVVELAQAAGLHELGENYAQELLSKARLHPPQDTTGAPRWHFIGHLQRNKIRQLAGVVSVWQSVDRVSVIDELARRAPGANILMQVNGTAEPQKAGCSPQDTAPLVEHARTVGLHVEGLMTVGPTEAHIDPRPAFDLVADLADRLGLRQRSMGMSADLEAAVQSGSTMVRVGTALFGPRVARPAVGN